MRAQPLVSVLMPAYNRPHYMKLALRSVLTQSYSNVEILISDNSTTDEVEQMLEPYLERHSHLQYHRNIEPLSPMDNGQQLLRLASGEYIAYLMDDDLFAPHKLTRMVQFLQAHPEAGMVTSHRQLIDAEGRALQDVLSTQRLSAVDALLNGRALSRYVVTELLNCIGEPTTPIFKRALVEPCAFGVYAGRQSVMLSDIATWLEIARHSAIGYLAESCSFFRIHAGQGQQQAGTLIGCLSDWVGIARDACDEGLLQQGELRQVLRKWMSMVPLQALHHLPIECEPQVSEDFVRNYEWVGEFVGNALN